MKRLAKITIEQVVELANTEYAEGALFNPIKIGGDWYISQEEVRDCVTVDWVKDLEVIEVEIIDQQI